MSEKNYWGRWTTRDGNIERVMLAEAKREARKERNRRWMTN